jgi:hypothetical protein
MMLEPISDPTYKLHHIHHILEISKHNKNQGHIDLKNLLG